MQIFREISYTELPDGNSSCSPNDQRVSLYANDRFIPCALRIVFNQDEGRGGGEGRKRKDTKRKCVEFEMRKTAKSYRWRANGKTICCCRRPDNVICI